MPRGYNLSHTYALDYLSHPTPLPSIPLAPLMAGTSVLLDMLLPWPFIPPNPLGPSSSYLFH